MDTSTTARPAQSKTSAATGRGALVPAGLVGAGISLIVVVGLIHLINSPGDLQEGSYTGLLYLANFLGALAAAVGIYRGKRWGWALGLLVAGGAFAGYAKRKVEHLVAAEENKNIFIAPARAPISPSWT
jgi:hypothetical protein